MKSIYSKLINILPNYLVMIHYKFLTYRQSKIRGPLLGGVIGLICLDVFTTSIAIDSGLGYEANSIMAPLVNNVSPWGLLLFKLIYLVPLIWMAESCDKSLHNSGIYIYLSAFSFLWVPVINNSLVLITQGQENLFSLLGLF